MGNHLFKLLVFFVLLIAGTATAQTTKYSGNNAPGGVTTFQFQTGAAITNFALTLPGTSSGYSFLYLKRGEAATEWNYDYSSVLVGKMNSISLELPQATPGTWYVSVVTPANAPQHAFTLTRQVNVTALRRIRAVSKPVTFVASGVVAKTNWNFFRIEVPDSASPLTIRVQANNRAPDLYVQRDHLPTTSSYWTRSVETTNDVIHFSDVELTPGSYVIGLYSSTTAAKYTLRTEKLTVTQLTFDPGTNNFGTFAVSNLTGKATNAYFKVRTENPSVGAWRTVLNVFDGEANLYASRGRIPTTNTAEFRFQKRGSDGFVFGPGQFTPGQDWYFLVTTSTNRQWSILSGAAFVHDLGELASDTSSGKEVSIGAEGWAFFKTSVPADTLAWNLRLKDATNIIYLKKTSVPLLTFNGHEASQKSQILVVPPYLVAGQQYFVGVPGEHRTPLKLESRQQPVTEIDFVSSTNVAVNDAGYNTFRVQVPPSEIAWQINLTPTTGNADLYIRRNSVPSDKYSDAYSEIGGMVTDSVTLVPPSLSDGTFFITVAATNTNSFRIQSGRPTITDISFSDLAANLETNRVGWRYFCLTNIEEQVGELGWDLLLTNGAPGTRIAVRRNQVPSAWSFRNGTSVGNSRSYTLISTYDFLQIQRPTYQADVWYVGVYNPLVPLSDFKLISRPLRANLLSGDGGLVKRTNAASFKWEYFRVDVPADVSGWDVRLTNVAGGKPKIIIRREDLPHNDATDLVMTTNTRTTLASAPLGTNWPGGMQWAVSKDWTQREFGPEKGNVSQLGRVFAAGMRRPLEPATYYIGVYNASPKKSSYTVLSRFIGAGRKINVNPLAFSGGTVTNRLMAPREAHYYRVIVPEESRSWKIKLTATGGEVMLVASTNKVPNVESEKRVQKLKNEHFLLLPNKGQSYLRAGEHYLAVISEGLNPTNNRVSPGITSYKLQTFGEMPEPMKGTAGVDGLSWSDTLEGGESKVYHFSVPQGVPGFYTIMNNRVGNPVKVGIGGMTLPDPGAADDGFGSDPYGNLGGENDPRALAVSNHRMLFSGNGTATLMVKSRMLSGGYANASYKIQVQRINPETVSFNNGAKVVTKQPDTWAFFRIDVPAHAKGWDVRLTNVVGTPKLIVARNWIPNAPDTLAFNPATSSEWPSGHRWAAGRDWTERTYSADGRKNEDGRILAMGAGRPLEPGTYYVGVYSQGPASYTLRSRGIGTDMAIPLRTLGFHNGSISISNLPPREAAYFHVSVPPGMPSWKLRLETTNSEANMLVLRGALPSVLGSSSMSATNPASAGRKLHKLGNENFLLLPQAGQSAIIPGDYYIAVAAEGKKTTNTTRIGIGLSSFKLTSVGPLPVVDLGTLTTNLVHTNSLAAGEVAAYQFMVPAGTVSIEAQLQNRIGNPVMVMRGGTRLPDPGVSLPVIGTDIYGNEGGENLNNVGSATVATLSNPTNGIYSILVKARATNSVHTNAQFTLRLSAKGSTPLAFDSGSVSVTNQSHGSWRYYRVDIPENALGWDVRLTNVLSGLPRLVIRKDALPSGITTTPWGSPGSQSAWPSSNQWAAVADWTRRQYSPNGAVDENYRILAMGMGRPLEPGSYYVGVGGGPVNSSNMTYTLVSRGIGEGFSIPVVDLNFNGGSATNLALPPREAAYFRIVVPENTPSWKMKVTGISGEFMLVGLRDRLPNVDYLDAARSTAFGKTMQKAGNEHFVLLPPASQTNIPAATNYFAVVSEGSATNAQRIGVGNSSFAIHSGGELGVTNLGTASLTSIEYPDSLEAGECKAYQFVVPEGAAAIEVKLENRVGNPVMALRYTNSLPDPGASGFGLSNDAYGNEGGHPINDLNPFLITVPNPVPGTYSLIVKARTIGTTHSAASYRIRIRELPVPNLAFGSFSTNGFTNVVSGLLETNQRTFFKVEIPAAPDGSSFLGWKLELRHQSGSASVRVRKDLLPSDTVTTSPPFSSPAAYVVPPYFTNGTWYVEVKGLNTTEFTLTSSPIELARPEWDMPGAGDTNVAPGLAHPIFGDTAVATNGIYLGPDGVFLEQGFQHFYGIVVPEGNPGLVRLQLDAISGNPDLFARTNHVSTLTHSLTGGSGRIVEREMKATTGTEYANWVPLDGKTEMMLRPGKWYFAVQAAGNANARYRLRLSAGNIQQAPLGLMVTNQIVAGGDWRHYQFRMPADATNWHMTFSQTSGDVWLYIREVVPPGNGISGTDYKHWASDAKGTGPFPDFNAPGSYIIGFPPAKRDVEYYIGFRAINDAAFSFRVDIAGSLPLAASSTAPLQIPKEDYVPPFLLNAPSLQLDGRTLHAEFTAENNRVYTIEVSDDLVQWNSLMVISNVNGAIPISESVDAFRKARFYRIRMD